ncbi:alpha/beta fold hydrolase [Gloeobacter kilaueensis]|uniref:Acetoin dehydrogenase E2 subunit dihydrolipoyllysine-residue acetyltransferase n=1 Tax=Gloeobacter kilaueensis (strain ATCC BAA-2537 / CCAP 1431/1 / ULC 316 / JS1) TaxID=1183438 RepID=U5QD67_GLOK1|nr:alpha/beta fold hydrolase [Gloeobacter kilaueensis]AGY56801.1 acetoin dehydrogenase E2 subunit dihydrolipoyllysine-residue acetyltransferase [Gloeobacter kilaueensis JS1]
MQLSVTNWRWRDQPIAFQAAGEAHRGKQPPLVLVHGFGASAGHWRKNLPVLAQTRPVWAIDLLGFGASAKPDPRQVPYTFETWGEQISDFVKEVVGEPAILVGNSIGAIVALEAAASVPDCARGAILINCSLRLLHERKRSTLPWIRRAGAPLLQRLLSVPAIGHFFFERLRRPETVRKILKQAYVRPEAITPELVEILTRPAADPGAFAVFQSFINYASGPLPEDLLPQVRCPVYILWGKDDPWEPYDLAARTLPAFAAVRAFCGIDRAGHCPQDEAPEEVNRQLVAWAEAITAGNP